MPLPQKKNTKYSYADYLTWPDTERWEIIDGIAFDMSPAPNRIHQKILLKISRFMANHLDHVKSKCEAYIAPFDVRFTEKAKSNLEILSVVQPDISIICDKDKLDDQGCMGAPDLIVEILSPSTSSKDLKEKFLLYQKYGVKEYWVVYPGEEVIHIYYLGTDGVYDKPEIFTSESKIKVKLFEEKLTINVDEVFDE